MACRTRNTRCFAVFDKPIAIHHLCPALDNAISCLSFLQTDCKKFLSHSIIYIRHHSVHFLLIRDRKTTFHTLFTCFDESINIDELDRISFGSALRIVVVPVVVPVVKDSNLPDALSHLWRKNISYNCVI